MIVRAKGEFCLIASPSSTNASPGMHTQYEFADVDHLPSVDHLIERRRIRLPVRSDGLPSVDHILRFERRSGQVDRHGADRQYDTLQIVWRRLLHDVWRAPVRC